MAVIAAQTAGKVELIEWGSPDDQRTLIASADITAPAFVRANASGKWELALATSAAAAAGARFAPRTVKAGEALTAYRRGVFGGLVLDALAFNASVFLDDAGTPNTVAGTASVAAGKVIPGTANQITAAHDKNLEVNLPE